MDSVRFGRSLGAGARSAARALAGAVEAAAAPNPSRASPRQTAPVASPGPQTGLPPKRVVGSTPASRPPSATPIANAAHAAARATVQARKTSEGVARGGRRFGEAIWGPLVKISGVLWLEITGAFFGLFALFAGQAAWMRRAGLRATVANHEARTHVLVLIAMALAFGYFSVSSFVRARRRERRT